LAPLDLALDLALLAAPPGFPDLTDFVDPVLRADDRALDFAAPVLALLPLRVDPLRAPFLEDNDFA
jgi:hypothetical protein